MTVMIAISSSILYYSQEYHQPPIHWNVTASASSNTNWHMYLNIDKVSLTFLHDDPNKNRQTHTHHLLDHMASIITHPSKTSSTTTEIKLGESPGPQQVILLHTRPLTEDEILSLRSHFPVFIQYHDTLHARSTLSQIVTPPNVFDCFTIPIYQPDALNWYGVNAKQIHAGVATNQYALILLRRSGENADKLAAFHAASIIKSIPVIGRASNRQAMLQQLLSSYIPAPAPSGWWLGWS